MRSVRLLAVLALAAAGWGLGAPVVAGTTQAEILDFGFLPDELSVVAGDDVTWTNTGAADHTVTADRGPREFDSGRVAGGARFSYIFEQAGTFSYRCAIHPSMRGLVHVAPMSTTSTAPPVTTTTAAVATAAPESSTTAPPTTTTAPSTAAPPSTAAAPSTTAAAGPPVGTPAPVAGSPAPPDAPAPAESRRLTGPSPAPAEPETPPSSAPASQSSSTSATAPAPGAGRSTTGVRPDRTDLESEAAASGAQPPPPGDSKRRMALLGLGLIATGCGWSLWRLRPRPAVGPDRW